MPRGRPRLYTDKADQPALVALRIPKDLERRLRDEATQRGCTLTTLLLQSLLFRWECGFAVDDVTRTQEQLAQLQSQERSLQGRHKRLRADLARIRRERDQARADTRRAEKARAEAEAEVRRYRNDYLARLGMRYASTGTLADHVRKELITLCHPDKWAQGQPATELGHEVMVYLNNH